MAVKVKEFTDNVNVKKIVRYGLFAAGAVLMSYVTYRIGAQRGVNVTRLFVANNLDPETYKKLDDAYKNLMK